MSQGAPLAGLKVLDASRLLPGPLFTRILADLGADVVKVESPSAPDPVRLLPPLDGTISSTFRALNRGKRSVAIDLKTESGRALFLELADRSDAVIEAFRPGVFERLGIGYDVLRERKPSAILCSVTGFGQHGPGAHRAGHDLGYLARSGVLSLSEGTRGTPGQPGFQFADVAGGSLSAAVALLAALFQRDRTGVGAHVDISMTRSSTVALVMALGQALEQDVATGGKDALAGALPCYRLYRTSDGRAMALAALEPKFFQAFCTAVGRPELVPLGWTRGEESATAIAELEAIFAARTQAEWVKVLGDVDCCCEPVLGPEESIADPIVGARTEHEGHTRILATDLGFGPRIAPAPTAALGEHTRAASEAWGVSAEVIDLALTDGGARQK